MVAAVIRNAPAQAALAASMKGVPSTSMRCMITASLRASATLAFCNGPGFVNPSFLVEHPFAGLVLLYGVGAGAAT